MTQPAMQYLCQLCDAPRASPIAFCPNCGESTLGYVLTDEGQEDAFILAVTALIVARIRQQPEARA